MRYMYIILGQIGWVAMLCAVAFAVGYLKGERDGSRKGRQPQGHEVDANDEKQS